MFIILKILNSYYFIKINITFIRLNYFNSILFLIKITNTFHNFTKTTLT